jgi:hypothetical protein
MIFARYQILHHYFVIDGPSPYCPRAFEDFERPFPRSSGLFFVGWSGFADCAATALAVYEEVKEAREPA